MNILVTGGSGSVGKYIVDELLTHHHTVGVLEAQERPLLFLEVSSPPDVATHSRGKGVVQAGRQPDSGGESPAGRILIACRSGSSV